MTLRTAALGALSLLASPCAAQWWWPPTDGLAVEPACIDAQTRVVLTVSGQWPDSCIPNVSSATVLGNEVELITERDPPPVVCLTVITNWSRTETVGPLPVGQYTVFVRHQVGGQTVHPRIQVGTFTVIASCQSCYANCDGSSNPPILTANDFTCFLNSFSAGEAYANCDGSTTAPVLTANDFVCFLNAFATGCT